MKYFVRIWLGDVFSDVGTSAYLFVIPLLAVTTFHLSDSALGIMVALLSAAPGILAAPLGAWADRLPAVGTLHLANLARVLLMLLLIFLLLSSKLNIVTLVAVGLVVSGISILYDCVIAGMVPKIVAGSDLTRANSLIEAGATVTSTAGEALGSVMLNRIGAQWVFLLNGISYLGSSIGLLLFSAKARQEGLPGRGVNSRMPVSLPPQERIAAKTETTAPTSTPEDSAQKSSVIANLKLWWSMPTVVALTWSAMLFNAALAFITTLLVPFALENVQLSVWAIGLLSVPAVILGVASPVLITPIERKIGTWATCVTALGGAILGIACFLFSAKFPGTGGGVLIALSLAILDFSAIVSLVVGRSYRQRLVPNDRQAGIAGLIRTITWGVDPLAAVLAGILSAYVLGRELTIAASGIFVIIGLVLLICAKKWWISN